MVRVGGARASVEGRTAAQAFGLGSSPFRFLLTAHRPPRRFRGPAPARGRGESGAHHLRELRGRLLPVAQLGAMLRCADGEHPAGELLAEPREEPIPLPRRENRRGGNRPRELRAGVGGVHVLPTGAGGAGEAPLELRGGYDQFSRYVHVHPLTLSHLHPAAGPLYSDRCASFGLCGGISPFQRSSPGSLRPSWGTPGRWSSCWKPPARRTSLRRRSPREIGRASCRERGWVAG